jgi:hypothetical protein
LRWVSQGGDDEVCRPDTLRGVSRRGPQAPLASASRLAEARFWALDGRWVLGRWVLGRWVLGRWVLGRWVFLGVGCAAGSPPGVRSTTRPLCETLDSVHEGPYREDCNGTAAVSILGISTELFASVGCFGRWALGVGCLALGVRQGRPGVQRLRGRWVALSPPVSRRPGRQTSSPPPRTSPPPPPKGREWGPRAAARPPNTPPGPNDPHMRRYREAEENFWALGV